MFSSFKRFITRLTNKRPLESQDDEKPSRPESKRKKVIAFYIDADGCVYNTYYYQLKGKNRSSEMTAEEEKIILQANKTLLEHIQKQIDANPADTEFLVGSFSARYSPKGDKFGAEHNGTSLFYAALPVLVRELQKNNPGKNIKLDQFLISALINNPQQAEDAAFVTNDPEEKFITTYDGSKLIYLYARLHRIKRDYMDYDAVVHLYDDLEQDILLPLWQFFTDHTVHIPDQMKVHTYQYGDEPAKQLDDWILMKFTTKITRLETLVGTGTLDMHFTQSVNTLNDFVNAHKSDNLIKLLKSKGLHWFKHFISVAERNVLSSTAEILAALGTLDLTMDSAHIPWQNDSDWDEREPLSEAKDQEQTLHADSVVHAERNNEKRRRLA